APERQALSAVLIGESAELSFDSDGRVILPETLRNLAGITDEATFVGMGQRFQIWEPKAYDAYYAKALEDAQKYRDMLRAPAAQGGGGQ
ncbi:MAG TPA: division/cell wall cluster transcriptional repressor MraZ, partial [Rhodobiaceae bacterium]|nr:division/cell wall cluster transcriptional repressor MraZ [Rhodobiaceae bacterium]